MSTITGYAPTCHLNGTAQGVLYEQVTDALAALRGAQEALDHAYPNARDYYPQGPGAFEGARAAHASRATRLREIQEELQTIAEAIVDQGGF